MSKLFIDFSWFISGGKPFLCMAGRPSYPLSIRYWRVWWWCSEVSWSQSIHVFDAIRKWNRIRIQDAKNIQLQPSNADFFLRSDAAGLDAQLLSSRFGHGCASKIFKTMKALKSTNWISKFQNWHEPSWDSWGLVTVGSKIATSMTQSCTAECLVMILRKNCPSK